MAASDMDSYAKPFRFMDLPGEIRNKVYKLLLCSFLPVEPPKLLMGENATLLTKVNKQAIDTSILLTNSQVHREAYDIMVKTNRFVLLRATSKVPLYSLLEAPCVPVVTADKARASQFKGYVMEIRLSTNKTFNKPPSSMRAMVLARDLPVFCEGMTGSVCQYTGFSEAVTVGIHLGPVPGHTCPRYQDSFADIFSEKTQQQLVWPFVFNLRGFTNVHGSGLVQPVIAKVVQIEAAKDEFPDAVQAVETLSLGKEEGKDYFAKGDHLSAYGVWFEALYAIDRMRSGTSWEKLVAQGGRPFIGKIADLYLMLYLNSVHIAVKMRLAGENLSLPHPTGQVEKAHDSLAPDFWQSGYEHQPPNPLLAKLFYRKAMCSRLWGCSRWVPQAVSCIENARRLLPSDPNIKKEEELIDQWIRELQV